MNSKELAEKSIRIASESIAEAEKVIARAKANGTTRRKSIRICVRCVKELKQQVEYWKTVAAA